MTKELLHRLRTGYNCRESGSRCRILEAASGCDCAAAADEITRLRAALGDVLKETYADAALTRKLHRIANEALGNVNEPLDQRKNWAVWNCIEHGRMFAAHAGCSYCREGRQPLRSELSADAPESQLAAVFLAAEKGEPVSAQDMLNALWWRVNNQKREIARLHEKRT